MAAAGAPTDAQLDVMVRWIARSCLEAERGLRPPGQLRQLMTESAWRRWQLTRPRGARAAGPVTAADVATPHLSRLTTERVMASVALRPEPGRWSGLSLQLEAARPGHWTITDLQLLRHGRHYRRTGHDRAGPRPLTDRWPEEVARARR